MMKFLKRLFCRHSGSLTFVRNIYGDEIRYSQGNRSIWSCDKCYGLVFHPVLYSDPVTQSEGENGQE